MKLWLRQRENGLVLIIKMIIHVKVKPGAKEEIINKIDDNNYEISVREKAEDNKANVRVINILAKEFRVSYKKISIKNPKSRKKIVEIEVQI